MKKDKYDNFLEQQTIENNKRKTRSSRTEEKEMTKEVTEEYKSKFVKKQSVKKSGFVYFILILTFLSVLTLFIFTMIKSNDLINRMEEILKAFLILVFTSFFLLSSLKNDKKGNLFASLACFMIIGYSIFNLGLGMKWFQVPTQEYVEDFTNKELTSVVKWASSNHVKVEQVYETSDLVDEYKIISQDKKEGTLVKNVDTLTVVVSSGPNYDKEVVLPSFMGKNVDDVIKFVEDNFLTNVNIDFKESDEERDLILEQDKKGQVRRNDTINLVASIGNLEDIGEMKIKDLVGEDSFHATTWLKRYGFTFTLEYDYSSEYKKGTVLKQSVEKDSSVLPTDTKVVLTISKGPKIHVPDLTSMSSESITSWVVDNNLKISFEEEYDEKIELGKVISASVKEGEEVEQGTLITIVISKGQLKMEKFTSAAEFRAWAEKYEVVYSEDYEFSDSIASGNIIKSSHQEGDIIKNSDTIKITISQGKSVTIPNFVGKSKSDITKTCSSVGLKCSFTYGGFSDSVAKDVATKQNKKSGSSVASGTSVVITLSSGKATSYSVVIQSSWLSPGNPDTTIATLKKKLEAACPGVTFKFTKKTVNTGVGLITQDSPVKGGSNTFVQGKTYNIYVGQA